MSNYKNLELTNEFPDLNEKILDLILHHPLIPNTEKDLAWQRIAGQTYFFAIQKLSAK